MAFAKEALKPNALKMYKTCPVRYSLQQRSLKNTLLISMLMIKPSSTAEKRRTNGGKRDGCESFAS